MVLLAAGSWVAAQAYEKGIQQADIQPQAREVAFVLAGRLWVSPLAGGDARLLETGPGRVESPNLSPDGREVVFLRWSEDFSAMSILSLNVPSGHIQPILTRAGDLDWDFDVDFRRRELLLSTTSGLELVSLESGASRHLTEERTDRVPRFSPDGQLVAFVRTRGDSNDIWVMTRRGGTPRRVQSSVTVEARFGWSPDSRSFVLESFDTGNLELWTLPLSGGAAHRISDDIGMENDPTWTADGRIYFHRDRQLWSMSEEGSQVRRVPIRCSLPAQTPASLLVRGGRVLQLASGEWLTQDLLIEEGRIRQMGTNLTSPSEETPVLDADGLFLIPGLLDLHTHYEPWMGRLMLEQGVTFMRDLGSPRGTDWILDEKRFVEDGHVTAPEIVAAGVVMNGSGPGTIGQIRTEDLQLIARTVEWLADQGVDLIKVGSENKADMLETLIRTAHLRGLPVWGHIALVPTRQAIRLGQDGIEHLRGAGWYSLEERFQPHPVPRRLTGMRREGAAWWSVTEEGLRSLAGDMAKAGTFLDPTLTVMDYLGEPDPRVGEDLRARIPNWVLHKWETSRSEGAMANWGPEDFQAFSGARENQLKFVKAFHDAGGIVTTGSDVGVELVVPGLSIHQEMAALVDCGISPLGALRAATSDAARAVRAEGRVGSLEVGKWGNLLVLERDPLTHIENTRSIRAVVNRGVIVTRAPTSSDR